MRSRRTLTIMLACLAVVVCAACGGRGSSSAPQDAGEADGARDADETDADEPARSTAYLQFVQQAHIDELALYEKREGKQPERLTGELAQRSAERVEVKAGTVNLAVSNERQGVDAPFDAANGVELEAGERYLVYAVGIDDPGRLPVTPTNPQGESIGLQMEVVHLGDEERPLYDGVDEDRQPHVRFLHAVPDGGALDLDVNDGDERIDGLSFGEISEPVALEDYLGLQKGVFEVEMEGEETDYARLHSTPSFDDGAAGVIAVGGLIEEEHRERDAQRVRPHHYPAGESADGSFASEGAILRFLHANTDVGPVDVEVNGETVFEDVHFRDEGLVVPAPAYSEVDISFGPAGRENAPPYLTERYEFPAGVIESYALYGLRYRQHQEGGLAGDLRIAKGSTRLRPADASETNTRLQYLDATSDVMGFQVWNRDEDDVLVDQQYRWGTWKDTVSVDAQSDVHLELVQGEDNAHFELPTASEKLAGELVALVVTGYYRPEEAHQNDPPGLALQAYRTDGSAIELQSVDE